jgi:ABC-type transport system involved in cytochrome c biogenesis permease subunit
MNSTELNSIMLYIHPPLALIGYGLVFVFAFLLFQRRRITKKETKLSGSALWLFTFLGLFTGMIWAQMAWGSYWSWDLKENLTLILFLTVSAGQVAYHEKQFTATKYIALLTCILTVITALSSFIVVGLHSYA